MLDDKLKDEVMLSELRLAYQQMIFLKRSVENEIAENGLHYILMDIKYASNYERYRDKCRHFYALCDRYFGPTLP